MAERKMPSVEDYPSASNGVKNVVDPVKMRGKVKTKRSFFKNVKGEFVSEDAPNIGNYILYDILLPALRDLVADIGHGALDMAMGTDTRRYSRDRRRSNDSYISYNRYYDDRDRRRRDRDDERYEARRRNHDLDDIIFDYREDAEDILDRMCDYLERYDSVPVSYMCDICGITVPGDFTKEDWGWINLSSAKVKRGNGGYYIDLPKARPI